jgi:hypothetical protein
MKIYLDTETCGLHSQPVLLQYAEDDGPIKLVNLWSQPAGDTLDLLEHLAAHTVVGFNLAFDWFHVCKFHTLLSLVPRSWIPREHIAELAQLEPQARDGDCLKPAGALDLMLYSRKGPYQGLMARENIRIQRIPEEIAQHVADELNATNEFDPIHFAGTKDPRRWRVYPTKSEKWKDVVLVFAPRAGLKQIAEHCLGFTPAYQFKNIEPPNEWRPFELGFAPWAMAVASAPDWIPTEEARALVGKKGRKDARAWPAVLERYIDHWENNEPARQYASDDIKYTRALDAKWQPPGNDDDSVLACMVAAIRWHGYALDLPALDGLLAAADATVAGAPCNVNKPREVRDYINAGMADTEAMVWQLKGTTRKQTLKKLLTAREPGYLPDFADRAERILVIKEAAKERELYRKLRLAGRFHAAFNVIGTLSSRMSGAAGLNAQAIKRNDYVRAAFPLAWEGTQLSGGDFDAFEVSIADAVYQDPDLHARIVSGEKLHAIFGTLLFPGYTAEQIKATEKTKFDMYTMAKVAVFALLYGGTAKALAYFLGLPVEQCERAERDWYALFPNLAKRRHELAERLAQLYGAEGGYQLGNPDNYVESFLGFRRYFDSEFRAIRQIHGVRANRIPEQYRAKECRRRDDKEKQTYSGALLSAIFGACFAVQKGVVRAATNHEIQSPGATITKRLQRTIWDLQPSGRHSWLVAPMNVHDEILCPTAPALVDTVAQTVRSVVEGFRDKVPLIGMKWYRGKSAWAAPKSVYRVWGEERITPGETSLKVAA